MIVFEIRNGKYDDKLDEILSAASERRKELQALATRYEDALRSMLEPAGSVKPLPVSPPLDDPLPKDA